MVGVLIDKPKLELTLSVGGQAQVWPKVSSYGNTLQINPFKIYIMKFGIILLYKYRVVSYQS